MNRWRHRRRERPQLGGGLRVPGGVSAAVPRAAQGIRSRQVLGTRASLKRATVVPVAYFADRQVPRSPNEAREDARTLTARATAWRECRELCPHDAGAGKFAS